MTDKAQTTQQAVVIPAPMQSMNTDSSHLILVPETFKALKDFATMMSQGKSTIPKHFIGNPADCMAVCMQAMQWKMNPWNVSQKTHVINGVLGYEGQLINAVITSMAATKDRINYEWFGPWEKVLGKFKEVTSKTKKDEDTGEFKVYRVPNWKLEDEAGIGIKVWATMKGESEPRILELFLSQCRVRNSPLWADDPRQQIAYLAVKRWARLHCPDVIMGVYTPDELQESTDHIQPRDTDIAGEAGRQVNPDYPEERFKSMLPKWTKTIGDGIRTRQQVIDQVETSYTLSKAQKDAIMALKEGEPPTDVKTADQKPPEAEAEPESNGKPAMDDETFTKKLQGYQQMIDGGVKPAQVLELLAHGFNLSAAQKKQINALKKGTE